MPARPGNWWIWSYLRRLKGKIAWHHDHVPSWYDATAWIRDGNRPFPDAFLEVFEASCRQLSLEGSD
jgi:hypothetical protein